MSDRKLSPPWLHDAIFGNTDKTMVPVAPKPSASSRCSLLNEAEDEEHDTTAPTELRICHWCQEILEPDDAGHSAENSGSGDLYDAVVCSCCHDSGVRF